MATKKYQETQLQQDNSLLVLHPETDADIVKVDNSSGHYGGSATDVQGALEELFGKNDYGYIELSSTSETGTITQAQFTELSKDFAIIKFGSILLYKAHYDDNLWYFEEIEVRPSSTFHSLFRNTLILNTTTLTYTESQMTVINLYTKSQTDTLLAGKQDTITDGSATIASESNGVVTLKAGVSQSGGAIANSTGTDITLGTSAKKAFTTSVTQNSGDLVTSGAVWTAIDNLPEPMIFKGSLGTGGTITDLPTASSSNQGWTYKVITAGTYASQSAKVGDLFISDGSAWVYIPSADEPSGTVTSVGLSTTASGGLVVTGSPITSSGTMTVNLDTAYGDKKNPYGSKTANYVLASPNGSAGNPTFRALVSNDIPDLSATYQPKDADLTAIAGLTGTSGLLKKTASNTWSLDTNSYITENQTITISGDASGSGKTAITLTIGNNKITTAKIADGNVTSAKLADSGVTAGAYSVVQVNAKGLVTAGNQLIEVGTSGQTTPSATLAVGGIFFKEI